MVLSSKPINGSIDYNLVNYNCTSASVESKQVSIVTNYENGNCDSFSVITSNSPNTLSVSLKTSLNQNCKKSSDIPLIVGLSVGLPIFVILCICLIVYLAKRSNANNLQSFGKDNNMQEMRDSHNN